MLSALFLTRVLLGVKYLPLVLALRAVALPRVVPGGEGRVQPGRQVFCGFCVDCPVLVLAIRGVLLVVHYYFFVVM